MIVISKDVWKELFPILNDYFYGLSLEDKKWVVSKGNFLNHINIMIDNKDLTNKQSFFYGVLYGQFLENNSCNLDIEFKIGD